MLKIEELKIEKRYERLTLESKEQFNALEKLIIADGEIYFPIVVWKGHKIVADGHSRVEILKKHPELKYSIKEIEFGDWQDVVAFIVEHHIARSSFNLWQKLEMSMNCVEYWEEKEQARLNRGKRTDLLSPSDKKLEAIDMDKIIAQKVGCSKTYVTMFNKVFNSPKDGIKQRCREGSMSIKAAYESLMPKKKKKGKDKGSDKGNDEQGVIESGTGKILDDSAKNQVVGGKSDNTKIPDIKSIVTEMATAQIPDRSIWFAINPIGQVIQIFKKTLDQEKGKMFIEVDNYSCKTITFENGLTILEACIIDGSSEELSLKDDVDFEKTKK